MKCPICERERNPYHLKCPGCGIIYAEYDKKKPATSTKKAVSTSKQEKKTGTAKEPGRYREVIKMDKK